MPASNASKPDSPSIMYDGSHDSIEENLKKTKEIVEMAHAKGITVEAEVGAIGGERTENLQQVSAQIRKSAEKLQRQELTC